VSHPDLRINSDASHVCARIKFHTCDDLMYKNQCHNFYYIINFFVQDT
jgi:hypothetical protein